ncbi:hypothetical protein V2J09_001003 [Rumex salicifolius]
MFTVVALQNWHAVRKGSKKFEVDPCCLGQSLQIAICSTTSCHTSHSWQYNPCPPVQTFLISAYLCLMLLISRERLKKHKLKTVTVGRYKNDVFLPVSLGFWCSEKEESTEEMAINRGLSCKWRWRCTAMLLMLLLPLMLPSLFVHGSRLLIEERQPRSAQVNKDKTNSYTVFSSSSSSSEEEEEEKKARFEFDDSDSLLANVYDDDDDDDDDVIIIIIDFPSGEKRIIITSSHKERLLCCVVELVLRMEVDDLLEFWPLSPFLVLYLNISSLEAWINGGFASICVKSVGKTTLIKCSAYQKDRLFLCGMESAD